MQFSNVLMNGGRAREEWMLSVEFQDKTGVTIRVVPPHEQACWRLRQAKDAQRFVGGERESFIVHVVAECLLAER